MKLLRALGALLNRLNNPEGEPPMGLIVIGMLLALFLAQRLL
jgi:hypothetical protein